MLTFDLFGLHDDVVILYELGLLGPRFSICLLSFTGIFYFPLLLLLGFSPERTGPFRLREKSIVILGSTVSSVSHETHYAARAHGRS
jgi:hypothetical protein